MSEKTKVEVWIAIDASGDYAVGTYDGGAIEAYESDVSSSVAGARLVCLNVSITPPESHTSIDVDIPDEAGTIVEASTEEPVEEQTTRNYIETEATS